MLNMLPNVAAASAVLPTGLASPFEDRLAQFSTQLESIVQLKPTYGSLTGTSMTSSDQIFAASLTTMKRGMAALVGSVFRSANYSKAKTSADKAAISAVCSALSQGTPIPTVVPRTAASAGMVDGEVWVTGNDASTAAALRVLTPNSPFKIGQANPVAGSNGFDVDFQGAAGALVNLNSTTTTALGVPVISIAGAAVPCTCRSVSVGVNASYMPDPAAQATSALWWTNNAANNLTFPKKLMGTAIATVAPAGANSPIIMMSSGGTFKASAGSAYIKLWQEANDLGVLTWYAEFVPQNVETPMWDGCALFPLAGAISGHLRGLAPEARYAASQVAGGFLARRAVDSVLESCVAVCLAGASGKCATLRDPN